MLSILPQVIIEGVITGMIIALVAMGVSLIWGVMYVVNFAQGELLMVSMFSTYLFTTYSGLDPLVCLPIVIAFMYLVGATLYQFLIKRVLKAPMLTQLLVTYSLSLVLINTAQIFFTARYKTIVTQRFNSIVRLLGMTISMTRIIPLLICIGASVIMYIILNKTNLGRSIKATALNRTAASLVGINPEKAYRRCVGLAAATAGCAGVAFSYYFYVYPSVGASFMNLGFVACCIGGMGSIPGVVLGGLIMGLIDSFVGAYFNAAFKYMAMFMLYIGVVYYRPKGFFGW